MKNSDCEANGSRATSLFRYKEDQDSGVLTKEIFERLLTYCEPKESDLDMHKRNYHKLRHFLLGGEGK